MAELQVVATIPATAEGADALRAALVELVAATRAEDGCLSYDLYESAAAPGTFVTLERWSGQDKLDAHLASPHVAAAIAGAQDLLDGEIAIHPLQPISVP